MMMGDNFKLLLLLLPAVLLHLADGAVHAAAPSVQLEGGAARVAMLCPVRGEKRNRIFQNKFLTPEGKWETDYGLEATCKDSPAGVLQYCKQAYPDLDIVEAVESKSYEKIGDWCRAGNMECKGPARWVKPYLCKAGKSGDERSSTTSSINLGKVEEAKKEEYYDDNYLDKDAADDDSDDDDVYYEDDIEPESSKLTGKEGAKKEPLKKKKEEEPAADDKDVKEDVDDDKDDDDDDDDDDEDYLVVDDGQLSKSGDEGPEAMTTTTTPSNKALESVDPYFTHYDPSNEHGQFSEALERLDKKHTHQMTKVMEEWTVVEEKYESLARTDPAHADKIKQEMADQFEIRIKELEKDNEAEKEQLVAMHQQRVVSRINQRKEEALNCYTESLNAHPVSYPQVRDCLEKLLRALHKDRHHTLAHYKALVETAPAQADLQREVTLKHLADVDRIVQESLGLLERFPDLRVKLLPLMEDFLIELRSRDDTPAPLFKMDPEHEAEILDGFRKSIEKRIQGGEAEQRREKLRRKQDSKAEYERKKEQEQLEEEEKRKLLREQEQEMEERRRIHLVEEPLLHVAEEEGTHIYSHALPLYQSAPGSADSAVTAAAAATSEVGFLATVMAVAILLVLLLVVLVRRRRANHHRSHQGFLEVPTYSCPEEKHLSALQVNGYENPTYKFFEANA